MEAQDKVLRKTAGRGRCRHWNNTDTANSEDAELHISTVTVEDTFTARHGTKLDHCPHQGPPEETR